MRDPEDLIRAAVARAALRPGPWIVGAFTMVLLSSLGSPLTALLGGCTGYLGAVLSSLASGAGALALSEDEDKPAALPAAKAAPLPPDLRERFREVHEVVQGMLATWPADPDWIPLAKEDLERIPETFRREARRLAATPHEDPGRAQLEARLEDLETHLARLRVGWTALTEAHRDEDAVQGLEAAADGLEGFLES